MKQRVKKNQKIFKETFFLKFGDFVTVSSWQAWRWNEFALFSQKNDVNLLKISHSKIWREYDDQESRFTWEKFQNWSETKSKILCVIFWFSESDKHINAAFC